MNSIHRLCLSLLLLLLVMVGGCIMIYSGHITSEVFVVNAEPNGSWDVKDLAEMMLIKDALANGLLITQSMGYCSPWS